MYTHTHTHVYIHRPHTKKWELKVTDRANEDTGMTERCPKERWQPTHPSSTDIAYSFERRQHNLRVSWRASLLESS